MIALTLLYAPADRPDLVRAAMVSDADVVILDLENSVVPGAKDSARAAIPGLLAEFPGRHVQVRVNAFDTRWGDADLDMIARLDRSVEIRVPNVDAASDVHDVVQQVPHHKVHALLQSPLSIERAYEIACSGVAGLVLAETHLTTALSVASREQLAWQRARVVNAAAAAGLTPPTMSLYPDVADDEGLAASCRAGRALGFLGRTAIHQRQLPIIRDAFMPTTDEVDAARALAASFVGAKDVGGGLFAFLDGTYAEAAKIRRAQRVLALAEGRPNA